jgi:lactoylglutathione lyase
MHLEHVAIWTRDLERLRRFYEQYFEACAGPKYTNAGKQFESYFLSFDGGARLELMRLPTVVESAANHDAPLTGFTHLAVSVGSQEKVDVLTARLKADGYRVVDGPRRTGDGYYESSVLDPDGNRIEITI